MTSYCTYEVVRDLLFFMRPYLCLHNNHHDMNPKRTCTEPARHRAYPYPRVFSRRCPSSLCSCAHLGVPRFHRHSSRFNEISTKSIDGPRQYRNRAHIKDRLREGLPSRRVNRCCFTWTRLDFLDTPRLARSLARSHRSSAAAAIPLYISPKPQRPKNCICPELRSR